ncbi:MAG: hypothetical protein ACD_79C00344G0002 [uncultured bacterium]|nr:MAG: hypothetical protein ACD_79C00344G0002 [uncultured bacterium]
MLKPGTLFTTSKRFFAPIKRISSEVITVANAGAVKMVFGVLDAKNISTFPSSSMLIFNRSSTFDIC